MGLQVIIQKHTIKMGETWEVNGTLRESRVP